MFNRVVDPPSPVSIIGSILVRLAQTAGHRERSRILSRARTISSRPRDTLIHKAFPPREMNPAIWIRWNRMALSRVVIQDPPSTNRFIAAFRLKERIMIPHHAAFSPKSPEGQPPPARSPFIAAGADSLFPLLSEIQWITWYPDQHSG